MAVKFGLGKYSVDCRDVYRGYPKLGVHVKSEYTDGKVVLTENAEILECLELFPERVVSRPQMFVRKDDPALKAETRTDYYLLLSNTEYKTSDDIDSYFIGACNTEQMTQVRLKFKIEECTFHLEESFKSADSTAPSLMEYYGYGDFEDFLSEELIPGILEKRLPFEECGIAIGKDEDYQILALDEVWMPFDFEISKRDLAKALVCIEIFSFTSEIVDAQT